MQSFPVDRIPPTAGHAQAAYADLRLHELKIIMKA